MQKITSQYKYKIYETNVINSYKISKFIFRHTVVKNKSIYRHNLHVKHTKIKYKYT